MESLGRPNAHPARDVADLLADVGPKLRRLRQARGMTLDDLAGTSGISIPHLSRLESGARQPSLPALLNVAAGLGVSVSELLGEASPVQPGMVVRGSQAPVYDGEGFRFQPLMPAAGPAGLVAVKVTFPVGRAASGDHRHEGQEWLYVLSGRLRLTLGDETADLGPGDAAFFDGMLRHAFEVLGDEVVDVLFVGGAVGDAREMPRGGPDRLHPLLAGHDAVGGPERRASGPESGEHREGHDRGDDG
ncbi:MAG: Transcriptional regulator SCO1200, Xre-family with cupin domain [uncultured Thermomicrobiales bacterium]|uniref:Transcriptional regulator SCO1200, Xre-family with cupin domain n=1 Tax=uncultured Thermomicrobiales bacterium TaxID=1645740 RepID=A0A6J4UVT8_9BACT|nr:MAG: Transcriptional regulator SCO1200, Xre-family with cupin domain [uncultured Thermomicrobiales bacterium]